MKNHRKVLNSQQKELRKVMTAYRDHDRAIELFLCQHALLHHAGISGGQSWSYEDFLLDDLTEEIFRRVPDDSPNSIAWHIWHLARIEDVTMNILVAGREQIFRRGNWKSHLGIEWVHTGNEMPENDIEKLTENIDLDSLRAYRAEVGRETRKIVPGLTAGDLKSSVAEERLERLLEEGALLPKAVSTREYWGSRTIAGLLLMPPTRHAIIHLNQAARIKEREQVQQKIKPGGGQR